MIGWHAIRVVATFFGILFVMLGVVLPALRPHIPAEKFLDFQSGFVLFTVILMFGSTILLEWRTKG
ncbi:MAG TPA: hypothetical protein VJB95_03015 [Candidatus Paceibacterota bacterium]